MGREHDYVGEDTGGGIKVAVKRYAFMKGINV